MKREYRLSNNIGDANSRIVKSSLRVAADTALIIGGVAGCIYFYPQFANILVERAAKTIPTWPSGEETGIIYFSGVATVLAFHGVLWLHDSARNLRYNIQERNEILQEESNQQDSDVKQLQKVR